MEETLNLSWRRFRVLFARGWKLQAKAEEESDEFDWRKALDKATGRETPSNVIRMTPEEYMQKVRA